MPAKREISPAVNLAADEYVSLIPEPLRGIISTIRAAKEADSRSRPSSALIDHSNLLTLGKRAALLDKVAELVDENVAGRSDMCLQFAALLNLAFQHLGFDSRAVSGTATYLSSKGNGIFTWHHAWVRVGREVIDGNTDSLSENIMVPNGLQAPPYWGPMKDGTFFVNIRFMFNGARLAFVKGYRLKGTGKQGELPLEEPVPPPALANVSGV